MLKKPQILDPHAPRGCQISRSLRWSLLILDSKTLVNSDSFCLDHRPRNPNWSSDSSQQWRRRPWDRLRGGRPSAAGAASRRPGPPTAAGTAAGRGDSAATLAGSRRRRRSPTISRRRGAGSSTRWGGPDSLRSASTILPMSSFGRGRSRRRRRRRRRGGRRPADPIAGVPSLVIGWRRSRLAGGGGLCRGLLTGGRWTESPPLVAQDGSDPCQ